LEKLLDLFQIIEQRIKQQNEGNLLDFRATVSYKDNSSVLLSGFEHLVSYNEPLPLVAKSIEMTWQYLIKFKDKPTPEKQEITIAFITAVDFRSYFDDDLEYGHFRNKVTIKISHTARTWGADIESMLTKHLSVMVKPMNKIQKMLMRMHVNFYSNIIPAFFFTVTLLTTFLFYRSGKVIDYVILFSGSYVFNKIAQIFINLYEPALHPAFLLITRESIIDKNKVLTAYNNRWKAWYITIGLSIVISIVSNILYVKYFEHYFQ
jgi:hypothetical protein